MYGYWRVKEKEIEKRTFRSMILASAFHALVVAGVYYYPQLNPPPPPLAGAVMVDFEAKGDALGEQTYTKNISETPVLPEPDTVVAPPTPVKAKKIKPKAKKIAKKAKAIVIPLADEGTPIPVDKPVEDSANQTVIETEDEESIINEALAAEAIEDEELTEETPAPIPAPLPEKTSKVATTQVAQSALPEKYGVPSGTKNYLDLKQRPGNRKPVYPYAARRQNHQGRTVLLYYVRKDGSIQSISVAKSSGYASLDNSAVNAVKNWKYYKGQSGWALHPINYFLNGPAQESFGRLRTRR